MDINDISKLLLPYFNKLHSDITITAVTNDGIHEYFPLLQDIRLTGQALIRQRRNMIDVMRGIAADSDNILKNDKGIGIFGSCAAIAGGAIGIAGSAALIFPAAGIVAIPAALSWFGVGCGISGTVAKVSANVYTTVEQKQLMMRLQDALKTELEIYKKLQVKIHDFVNTTNSGENFKITYKGKEIVQLRDEDLKRIYTTFPRLLQLCYKCNKCLIPATAKLLKDCLQVVHCHIEGVAAEVVATTADMIFQPAVAVAEEALKAGGNDATGLAMKESAKAVVNQANKTLKHSAVKIAKVTAEQAFKEGGDDAVRLVAQGTSEAVVNNVGKVAMVVGRTFMAIGIASVALDIYQIVQKVKEKSMGDTFREIADYIEEHHIPKSAE